MFPRLFARRESQINNHCCGDEVPAVQNKSDPLNTYSDANGMHAIWSWQVWTGSSLDVVMLLTEFQALKHRFSSSRIRVTSIGFVREVFSWLPSSSRLPSGMLLGPHPRRPRSQ